MIYANHAPRLPLVLLAVYACILVRDPRAWGEVWRRVWSTGR